MKGGDGRQESLSNCVNSFLKTALIVYMREEISIVKHVDPNLPIGNYFGGKRFF